MCGIFGYWDRRREALAPETLSAMARSTVAPAAPAAPSTSRTSGLVKRRGSPGYQGVRVTISVCGSAASIAMSNTSPSAVIRTPAWSGPRTQPVPSRQYSAQALVKLGTQNLDQQLLGLSNDNANSNLVIAETVATPIELEVNGVDDMLYIESQSTGDGRLSINVVFKPGVDIDQAQVLVQNRVSAALALLKTKFPTAVPSELKTRLLASSTPRTNLQCSGLCSAYPGSTPIEGQPNMCYRPCGGRMLNLSNAQLQ